MGNFFCLNRITCPECKKLRQEPVWFTKEQFMQPELTEDLAYRVYYDKYGNEINRQQPRPIQIEYCCSFGHKFVV